MPSVPVGRYPGDILVITTSNISTYLVAQKICVAGSAIRHVRKLNIDTSLLPVNVKISPSCCDLVTATGKLLIFDTTILG